MDVSEVSFVARDPDTMENNDEFAQSTLETLNSARRQYHSPPLELNDDLSQIAQRCTEEMARKGKLQGSPVDWRTYEGQVIGENYTATFQIELTGHIFPERKRSNLWRVTVLFRRENDSKMDERRQTLYVRL